MDDWLFIPSLVTASLAFGSPGIAMLLARSTVRYAPYSYAFGLTSFLLWVAFGVHYELDAMCVVSTLGAVAYAGYLVAFLRNADVDDPRRACLIRYVAGGCLFVLFAGFLLHAFASQGAFDNFCSTVACFASAAPLWNLPTVCRTKTMDSMPSPVVAGLLMLNAVISTIRNTSGVESVNLNLAVPSGLALLFALVQVMLHLGCWCLPRPPLAPPAVDRTPLLENQAEDDHARVEDRRQVDDDLRGLGHDDKDNDTRVDVAALEKIAHANNEINDFPLQEGLHGGQEEKKEAPTGQEDKDAINVFEVKPAHVVPSDEGCKIKLLDPAVVPQPGEKGQADKKEETTGQEDKDVINVVEAKPAQVVASHESSKITVVDPDVVPQQGEKGQEEKKEEPTGQEDKDGINVVDAKPAQEVASNESSKMTVDPAVEPQQGQKA